jgi:hypothetical protein
VKSCGYSLGGGSTILPKCGTLKMQTISRVEAKDMTFQAHLSELTAKHKALEAQIEQELAHPGSNDLMISELKRKKLKLKDEITRLESQIRGH